MHDIDRPVVKKRAKLPYHLELFSGKDADRCTAPEVHPTLVKDRVHRVLEPQRVHGLDDLCDLNRAQGVELSVSVHG